MENYKVLKKKLIFLFFSVILISINKICCNSLTIYDCSKLFANKYQLIYFENIEFENLTKFKSKTFSDNEGKLQTSEIFLSKDSKFYYKIWNPQFVFVNNFINALIKDFFDDISPLIGIIVDYSGEFRGYITEAKKNINPLELFVSDHGHYFEIKEIQFQNNLKYIKLFNKLIEKSIITNFIYADLHLDNLVQDENQFYIIDLDSVLDIQDFQLNDLKNPLYTCPNDYFKIVSSLIMNFHKNRTN